MISETSVTLSPPENFSPCNEAAICFCLSKGRLLLLKRASHCSHPGNWCSPGGRFEAGETKELAVIRELKEETGIEALDKPLEFLNTLYIRTSELDYTLHFFRTDFDQLIPSIRLSDEHDEFRWLPLSDVANYSLMPGEKRCFDLIFG